MGHLLGLGDFLEDSGFNDRIMLSSVKGAIPIAPHAFEKKAAQNIFNNAYSSTACIHTSSALVGLADKHYLGYCAGCVTYTTTSTHSYAAATCLNPAKCSTSGCGVTSTPALGHTSGSGNWLSDNSGHWKICGRTVGGVTCQTKVQNSGHTPGGWQSNGSQHWRNCTACSAQIGTTVGSHYHQPSCGLYCYSGCGYTQTSAPHSFSGGDCDKPVYCGNGCGMTGGNGGSHKGPIRSVGCYTYCEACGGAA